MSSGRYIPQSCTSGGPCLIGGADAEAATRRLIDRLLDHPDGPRDLSGPDQSNDDILPLGATYWVNLVDNVLGPA